MNYNLKHYAYIGDCVWELFVRERVIKITQKQDMMHKISTKFVNAKAQADILELFIEKLSEEELEIQKRGRNLKITINKKSNPKIHALATSFEVLIGYWHINDKLRLNEIFELIKIHLEEFGLSERQINLVKDYLINKTGYKELGQKYFMSTSTVKKDMNDVFKKFDVKNINELYLLLIQYEVE